MTSSQLGTEVGGAKGAKVSLFYTAKRGYRSSSRASPGIDPVGSFMEFPDLGAHCTEPSCKRLAYKKDIQVPVCPLCSTPIPVKRGEMPDIVVGAHIDQDCKSDPAQRKRKIFTNKCQRPGCKQREMMKVLCDQCHGNFCLKHRHPLDHDCSGTGRSLSKAGNAAIFRAQKSAKEPVSTTSSGAAMRSHVSQPTSSRSSETVRAPQPQSPTVPVVALQNGLSEEEALQRALEITQEEEDLALARALSASEEEYQQQQQRQQARSTKPSNCCLS
ncbi:hypothetical protein E2320_020634 [Naja naja]|nr:hypothetical protein E2320_020634 [Naja naja]